MEKYIIDWNDDIWYENTKLTPDLNKALYFDIENI